MGVVDRTRLPQSDGPGACSFVRAGVDCAAGRNGPRVAAAHVVCVADAEPALPFFALLRRDRCSCQGLAKLRRSPAARRLRIVIQRVQQHNADQCGSDCIGNLHARRQDAGTGADVAAADLGQHRIRKRSRNESLASAEQEEGSVAVHGDAVRACGRSDTNITEHGQHRAERHDARAEAAGRPGREQRGEEVTGAHR